jgi:hypothetical protein
MILFLQKNHPMKKVLLALIMFLSITAFGQTDKQISKIADETCSCLKTKDLKKGDMQQIQMELGICMLASMGENGFDGDLSDLKAIEEIGERVGMQLAFNCPEFLELMGTYAAEDPEGFNELIESADDDYNSTEMTSGTALSVESGDFVVLKIQNENGKKETLYWFQHFDGAELLEDGGASLLNKDIMVEYEIIEYYNPKIQDYMNLKVLRGIYIDEY